MKYINVIVGCVCGVAGAFAGYYYGKKKEIKAYEADIASMKEEYQKKIDDARKKGRLDALSSLGEAPEGEKQKLKPNGDIDDEVVDVVSENEALDHNLEDVVYFGKDDMWYNQDQERTYDKTNVFNIPTDFFTYFGPDKADLIYLHNQIEDKYYAVRYNPGSYVSNVLGYDDSPDDK